MKASRRVFIFVEGQTEETFVNSVLGPHLAMFNIYCTPVVAKTKINKKGVNFKGGITSYNKIRSQILKLLRDSSVSLVTTMIDFYGFPTDTPFENNLSGKSALERAEALESLFLKDIGHQKFLPYLQLHEFEALIFVSPEITANKLNPDGNRSTYHQLQDISSKYNSPEEINDNPATIPSRRLLEIFPNYNKVRHGSLVTNALGIGRIREMCPHFHQWLSNLERL